MKFTINQIKEFTDVKASNEELVDILGAQLGEVESTKDFNKIYKHVLIGEVIDVKQHPSREKLQIVKLSLGSRGEKTVVAGGPKLGVGDLVPYLPIGAKFPVNVNPDKHGDIVEKASFGGVASDGVLLSARELGIGDDHTRVLTFGQIKNVSAGQTVAEAFGLDDFMIDIENKALTARPDCFGIIGLAREIAGIQGIAFKSPQWLYSTDCKLPSDNALPLQVETADDGWHRYTAITMKDVKIGPSPLWLQIYLMKVGIRPINNVVDITNYLMVLTGQPLHAFDYDKVKDRDEQAKEGVVITVRKSRKGESIVLIDGSTIDLDDESVVICDSSSPIAVAGIMGGLDTEIDDNTKNIIIEAANFDMYAIRKTSNRLGITSDALTRFARGQDPNLCLPILVRASEMIAELAHGSLASSLVDVYPDKVEVHNIKVNIPKLLQITSLDLSMDKIISILKNVELGVEKIDDENIEISVPTWRPDLRIKEDIYEEILRLYGYKYAKLSMPNRTLTPVKKNRKLLLERSVRDTLVALGGTEVLTYSFVGENLYKAANVAYRNGDNALRNAYRLINSLSPELEYIRPALLPSMLEPIARNVRLGYEEFMLFEINKVDSKTDVNPETQLPIEFTNVSLSYVNKNISGKDSAAYFHVKYFVDSLLSQLKIFQVEYQSPQKVSQDLPNWIACQLGMFDVNRVAVISVQLNNKKHIIGIIGEPKMQVIKNFKLPEFIAFAELNIDELLAVSYVGSKYQEPSKYPKVSHDLCFEIDKDVPYSIIQASIKESLAKEADLNFWIKPLDIYQANSANQTRKITIKVTFQSKVRTLEDQEIDDIRKRIIRKVRQTTGGTLCGEN